MRQNSGPDETAEKHGRDIRRATRRKHSAAEKIRIVLAGLRGEHSIAEPCRREGIAEGLYYSWSKEFLEAGKKRLAGDTQRQVSSGKVKELRRETRDLDGVLKVHRRLVVVRQHMWRFGQFKQRFGRFRRKAGGTVEHRGGCLQISAMARNVGYPHQLRRASRLVFVADACAGYRPRAAA